MTRSFPTGLPRRLVLAAWAALAAACAEPHRGPFTASGEVIAMGGGDAGAQGACFTCHGLRGEGDGQTAPRLAGLQAGYLRRQLQAYADGRRDHAAMTPIARALDEDDRRAVSDYYAALPWTGPAIRVAAYPQAAALYQDGDPARGIPACAVCHGRGGEGVGPANPPLAGQPPGYLAQQLRLWRESRRRNDARDVMLRISRRLAPGEVETLSRYAAALSPPTAAGSAPPAASP